MAGKPVSSPSAMHVLFTAKANRRKLSWRCGHTLRNDIGLLSAPRQLALQGCSLLKVENQAGHDYRCQSPDALGKIYA
jgi:hypothetical protein